MLKLNLSRTLAALGLLGAFAAALNSAPAWLSQMNYQGQLTDASGNAVSDGAYSVQFLLYTVPTGGSNIWTETQSSVQVSKGLFNVILGSVTPISLADTYFTGDLYLALNVAGNGEMTPRQLLLPNAFAYNAQRLGGNQIGTGSGNIPQLDASGKLPSSMIAAGSVNVPLDMTGNGGTYNLHVNNTNATGKGIVADSSVNNALSVTTSTVSFPAAWIEGARYGLSVKTDDNVSGIALQATGPAGFASLVDKQNNAQVYGLAAGNVNYALLGVNTGAATNSIAIGGNSASGIGVSATGGTYGLYAASNSGDAVHGVSIGGYGVYGSGSSGVYGTSSSNFGVYGTSGYIGVYGTGSSVGVYGLSSAGNGVDGISNGSNGVYGSSSVASAAGGYFINTSGAAPGMGLVAYGYNIGVSASADTGYAVEASGAGGGQFYANSGQFGLDVHSSSNWGIQINAPTSYGLVSYSQNGNYFQASAGSYAIYASNSGSGYGIEGVANTGIGVNGSSNSSNGVVGSGFSAIKAQSNSSATNSINFESDASNNPQYGFYHFNGAAAANSYGVLVQNSGVSSIGGQFTNESPGSGNTGSALVVKGRMRLSDCSGRINITSGTSATSWVINSSTPGLGTAGANCVESNSVIQLTLITVSSWPLYVSSQSAGTFTVSCGTALTNPNFYYTIFGK